jgi:uncharacterized coiled-coil DUF342 family protein
MVDQTSKLLGELSADMKSLRSQTKAQWEGLEHIKQEHHETNALLRALATEFSATRSLVDKMTPVVEDYKRMKQRGITVLMMIGFLAGGLGALGTKLSEIFFAGGG